MKNELSLYILNHYALTRYNGTLTRHFDLAPHLSAKGCDVTIFTSSAIHNSSVNMITDRRDYLREDIDGRDYVFVRTRSYTGNRLARLLNISDFYFRSQKVLARFEKPDVLLASSPHLFTLLAGLRAAKRFGVPCVCEVRDLWPESIVAYLGMSPKNPIIMVLRALEKRLYEKSDALVFTMKGGPEYVKRRGWENTVSPDKQFVVGNGIDIAEFDRLARECVLPDPDLDDPAGFKLVYCGSIRLVNHLKSYIDAMLLLKRRGYDDIKFILYGDGNERPELEAFCAENGLDNVKFRGFADKKYMPSVVSRSDANCISVRRTEQITSVSWTKLGEYFAAGKPIISNDLMPDDPILTRGCGVTSRDQSPEAIADAILYIYNLSQNQRSELGSKAREASAGLDNRLLADELLRAVAYALDK